MDIGEVPRFPERKDLFPETPWLRREAPNLLVKVIEEGGLGNVTSLEDLPQGTVSILAGGTKAASYWLHSDDEYRVVKFQTDGLLEAGEWLKRAQDNGVSVPKVIAAGTLFHESRNVEYLVLDGIALPDGTPAPTVTEVLRSRPDDASLIGQLTGKEIAKVHKIQAPSDMPYGFGVDNNLQDLQQEIRWNDLLMRFIKKYNSSFSLINEQQMQQIKEKIDSLFFNDKTYMHQDTGTDSSLIQTDPFKATIFDPVPGVGTRYWDLACVQFFADDKRMLLQQYPDNNAYQVDAARYGIYANGFMQAYEEQFGESTDPKLLTPCKLAWAVRRLDWLQNGPGKDQDNPTGRIEVTKQLVDKYTDEMLLV